MMDFRPDPYEIDRVENELALQKALPAFVEKLQERIAALERKSQQQDRTIVGLQNELIRAGKYDHEDPDKLVAGIQILLQRAGEYQGRQRGRR